MSNRYSRIFHHISTNDLKRNREITIEKIEEVKKIKEEERTIFEIFKHDWRRELKEGMTSSDVFTTTISPAEGDAGSVSVKAPLEVSQKYPSPDTAVKFAVLIDVCQLTVPFLPNPVCVPEFVIVAPAGIVIVSPLSPN